MTEGMQLAPFRIAIRQEGSTVNAYVASVGTMDDARFLGSIAVAPLNASPELFEDFKSLMKNALAAQIKEVSGEELAFGWAEEEAPESERSGNA